MMVRIRTDPRLHGRVDPEDVLQDAYLDAAASDVYSLGLTLYELLTLQPAYEDSNPSSLIRKITQEEPPRPRKLNPRIPRDLETIVLKTIARDPAHRHRSAGELADDLQRFLDDRPIRARRVGPLSDTMCDELREELVKES